MADEAEVVPVADESRARSRAAAGIPVVVAGTDADAVAGLVAWLRAAGARAAGFVGDPADPAAGEMARELYPATP